MRRQFCSGHQHASVEWCREEEFTGAGVEAEAPSSISGMKLHSPVETEARGPDSLSWF